MNFLGAKNIGNIERYYIIIVYYMNHESFWRCMYAWLLAL